MKDEQLQEGLSYAEYNYHHASGFSRLDKSIIRENFNLKEKSVLDFGCGMGHMSLWLGKEMCAFVDGVDIDEHHITVAKEFHKKYQIPNVNFYLRNIISDPVEKQYDFIFLNDVIEHIREEWLQNVLDVLIMNNLKDGGIIFFSYPPWEGPHASHLRPATSIPWVQYLPQRFVINLVKKRNQQLVGENTLLEEYLQLNHMSHKKLTNYLKKYSLKQILRKSHSKINKIGPFKNTNLNFSFFKYIVTKELIAFQKV